MGKNQKGAGGQSGAVGSLRLEDNSTDSQQQRILHFLQKVGPMTTLQARASLNVLHPGGRVLELRKKGHRIITHWCTDYIENFPHRVARYVLISLAKEGVAQ
jgi:hypothetical protein